MPNAMSCIQSPHQISVSRPSSLHRLFHRQSRGKVIRIDGVKSTGACLNVETTKSADGAAVGNSKEVMEAEKKLLVGTYARTPVVLASGKGCKLYDVEGREYLDLTSGIAVNALGHGDSDWVKAVVEQANLLTHVSNVYYSIPQVYAILDSWFFHCLFSCYSAFFFVFCFG